MRNFLLTALLSAAAIPAAGAPRDITFNRQILPYHSSALLSGKLIDHSLDEDRNQRATTTSHPRRARYAGNIGGVQRSA